MEKPTVLSRKEVSRVGYVGIEELELKIGNKTKIIPNALYPDVVVIIPMPENDSVLMQREYRPNIGKSLIGFPGGKADKETDLETAARRELLEELGYTCGLLEKSLTVYPLVGLSSVRMHIFIAKDLEKAEQNLDDDENISVERIKLQEIQKLVESGEIAESRTLIGLMLIEKELGIKIF